METKSHCCGFAPIYLYPLEELHPQHRGKTTRIQLIPVFFDKFADHHPTLILTSPSVICISLSIQVSTQSSDAWVCFFHWQLTEHLYLQSLSLFACFLTFHLRFSLCCQVAHLIAEKVLWPIRDVSVVINVEPLNFRYSPRSFRRNRRQCRLQKFAPQRCVALTVSVDARCGSQGIICNLSILLRPQ